MNPETMEKVNQDGQQIGEIMIKGNCVMKGYLKNKEETDKSMSGGWFHSGDLAVIHPNGYIQIKDRSKDIIKFCKETLAGFKCPKKVIFRELPKTSTGKILKYELREIAKAS